tara:strand:- start:7320 stop:7688 length:369 start_codon:yes stop_codon:yes gene_type:complete
MSINFSLSELECSCGCPENLTKVELLDALQAVRDILDKPMKITSGYRCAFHNKGVGGSESSSHLFGTAADIYVPSSNYGYEIMRAIFLSQSFCRVGYGKMSGTLVLHVDIDSNKASPVLWGY